MTSAVHATTIAINNLDGAGEGFNDTTPRSPEGGNPGTTLGALRLNAFNEAADRWEAVLSSSVAIEADSHFDPLTPCGGGALLGFAGPNTIHRDFVGAPVASTWYGQAEANSLNGSDLAPGTADLAATFNGDIDTGCLPGITGWYYGFDGNPPAGKIDFVPVLLHELAHSLGFLTFVDLASGAKIGGFNDIFMTFLENHSTGLFYSAMTDGQRVTASINSGNLHWVGANVAAPSPQEPGSSVSHWDTALSPNELMEPFDTGSNFRDLTEAAFDDMGWTLLPQSTATPTPTFTPRATCTPPAPAPTATPITSGALKCKRGIAKSASKFYAAKTKILQKCEGNVVKTGAGSCPDGTATAKIANALAKLASGIDKACGGDDKVWGGNLTDEEPPAGLGWPATCPNFEGNADPDCSTAITDCGDIAACIGCVGEAAIGKASAKFVLAKEKSIQKCWDAPLLGKHAGTCPNANAPAGSPAHKAALAIAKADAKKITAICKACGGGDLHCDDDVTALDGTTVVGSGAADDLTPAAIGFLPTCPAVQIPGGTFCDQAIGTLADLVECVACVSEFKVDCADRVRVPEFGVYPCECNP
jgi:hypothetical protein